MHLQIITRALADWSAMSQRKDQELMFNGNDHGTVGAPTSQTVESNPKLKPVAEEKPRPAEDKTSESKKS